MKNCGREHPSLTKHPHPIVPCEMQIIHSGYSAVYGAYEDADVSYSWMRESLTVVGLGRPTQGIGNWVPCVLTRQGQAVLANSLPNLAYFSPGG